ncbi:MAG: hypothetical protein SP1CHLAM54_06020 [Chlamydiia bacterium]|nr:hypothetical protein [Chlamydiia bacterium]MCH9615512.1 hypothetical protein [Chlamydiia bacterium]MCH9629167.1 hypothetical protein [Chlamydiia bacterium]
MCDVVRTSSLSAAPQEVVDDDTTVAVHAAAQTLVHDTLATASNALVPELEGPSKPNLPPQVRLAQIADEQGVYSQWQIQQAMDSIKRSSTQVAEQHRLSFEAKKAEAEIEYTPTWWDWAFDAVYAVTAAASIVVGGTLLVSGLPPAMAAGGALVGAGIASLGTIVMNQIGGDTHLARGLGMAFSGVSLLLLGSTYFFYSHLMPALVTSILTSTYAVTAACNEVTKGVLQKSAEEIKALLSAYNHKLQLGELFRQQEVQKMQETAKESLDVSKALTDASESLDRAKTSIIRA